MSRVNDPKGKKIQIFQVIMLRVNVKYNMVLHPPLIKRIHLTIIIHLVETRTTFIRFYFNGITSVILFVKRNNVLKKFRKKDVTSDPQTKPCIILLFLWAEE